MTTSPTLARALDAAFALRIQHGLDWSRVFSPASAAML